MTGPSTPRGVVVIVALVGLFDIATGLFLLFSPEPWLANGPGTVWLRAPAVIGAQPEAGPLMVALFRRIGAFSLHAGVVTAAGAWLGRGSWRLMTGLLVLWMIDGLAFFATDRAAFAGTTYFFTKQVIGTFWAAALGWQLSVLWRAQRR